MTVKRPLPGVLYGERVNNAAGSDFTKKGIAKHLQPGVVRYENEDGSFTTYLLELDGIEAMRPTAAGIPVVGKSEGFDHTKVKPGKEYDGKVNDSFWDGQSGWEAFHFDGMNADTAKACEKGFQASCAYVPTETDGIPGLWHNVPYDEKILNGRYTHVAIVPNPRYDGAEIEFTNSLPGGIMNKVLKAALSLVPRKELREVFNAIEAEAKSAFDDKKKAAKEEAKNAFDKETKDAGDDESKKKAAKDKFEKANAAAEAMKDEEAAPSESPEAKAKREKGERVQALRNEADALEKEIGASAPLGGGDVQPEPGLPASVQEGGMAGGAKPNAAPPAVAAEAAAEGETPAHEMAEKKALEKKNADEAAAKAEKDRIAKEATEKTNALATKARLEAEAKAEIIRQERFNNLKRLAEERGGPSGVALPELIMSDEKADLGRARYGSR